MRCKDIAEDGNSDDAAQLSRYTSTANRVRGSPERGANKVFGIDFGIGVYSYPPTITVCTLW